MISLAWILALCALPQAQDVRYEVELKVEGLWSPECHVVIRKALAAVTGVEAVHFSVDEKKGARIIVALKADSKEILLSQVKTALASAAREQKGDVANMVVEYKADEDQFRLPIGTEFVAADGRHRTEIDTTMSELRKTWKATDVALPKRERCAFTHACAADCSVSNAAGTCPACVKPLLEKTKPPSGG